MLLFLNNGQAGDTRTVYGGRPNKRTLIILRHAEAGAGPHRRPAAAVISTVTHHSTSPHGPPMESKA